LTESSHPQPANGAAATAGSDLYKRKADELEDDQDDEAGSSEKKARVEEAAE